MAEKKSGKKSKDRASKAKASSTSGSVMGYPVVEGMRGDMERMMRGLFSNDWMKRMTGFPALPGFSDAAFGSPFASLTNMPRADLAESDAEYELNVELPGLDEEDVELSITDHTLLLKGKKTSERESDEKDYHFSERHYGSVRREFPLPADVDRDALKARFTNGVLTVTLPKSSDVEANARRIEVSTS